MNTDRIRKEKLIKDLDWRIQANVVTAKQLGKHHEEKVQYLIGKAEGLKYARDQIVQMIADEDKVDMNSLSGSVRISYEMEKWTSIQRVYVELQTRYRITDETYFTIGFVCKGKTGWTYREAKKAQFGYTYREAKKGATVSETRKEATNELMMHVLSNFIRWII